MILGLGVDIVELDRIRESWDRFGLKFAEKILAPEELEDLPKRHPVPFLAVRFAAKEAAAKALGTGFSQGVTLRSLVTRNGPAGEPILELRGVARELADRKGVGRAHVSLTHGRDAAVAVVVLEE